MSLPLLLSLLALGVGPLIYRGARARGSVAAVDAFALVGVAGLVLVHILPQSFAIAGWSVIPTALLGAFGPGLLCGTRLFSRGSRAVALPLALLALGLHALLDGVAIASDRPGGPASHEITLAVVLHRVPDGLGIWWLVRPVYGLTAATSLLAGVGVFSILGYLFGGAVLAAAPQEGIALVQTLFAGSLLHVILRHPPTATGEEPERRWHVASALGGLAAIAVLVGMGSLHLHEEAGGGAADAGHASDVGHAFLTLALESAPALLIAYLMVALAHALLFDLFRVFRFLSGGRKWSQALRGTLIGLPMPVCSCGIIPLYRSLIVGGVPATAAMAFLVAAPELEVSAVVLSLSLLGPQITFARVGAAFLLALLVGRIAGAMTKRHRVEESPPRMDRPPLRERLAGGMRYGFADMVDSTAPWILVGLAVAAVAEPLLNADLVGRVPSLLQVPLLALLGMPVYVCASGSTPFVAVLLANGVSPGAGVAFLLTGPATNVTTFGVLAQLHGRTATLIFAGTAALFTIAIGYAIDALLSWRGMTALPVLEEHAPAPWAIAALVVLGVVYLISLARQGVRGFIGQVIAPHAHSGENGEACCHADEPAHVHGPGHGHAH